MPHDTSTPRQGAAWHTVGQAMLEGCLRRAVFDAQLALGERMYAAGIDDGQLGAQIAALDERIRQAEVAMIPTRTLKVEREILVLQLAAAALVEEAPLPGADAEYERAREALAALAMHTIRIAAKAQRSTQPASPSICRSGGSDLDGVVHDTAGVGQHLQEQPLTHGTSNSV